MTNPSFNFKWEVKKKNTGSKAFARKRSQKNVSNKVTNKLLQKGNNKATAVNEADDAGSTDEEVSPEQDREVAQNESSDEQLTLHARNVGAEDAHSSGKQEAKKSSRNRNKSNKHVSEKLFISDKTFRSLPEIHNHILANLEKENFLRLTTVQEKSIPVILEGKNTLVRSQTGSGKTLAYAVPILNALLNITPKLKRQDGIQALIIVPTRELALQTHEIFNKINTFQWIVTGHLCGGENRKTEKDRLRKGVHILIGTPGRLLDHMLHTAAFKIVGIKYLVLDEADRLLDMGFRKDITRLVQEIDKAKLNSSYDPLTLLKTANSNTDEEHQESDSRPSENEGSKLRQTILLSATLSKGVTELADFTMKDHVFVDALDGTDSAENSSNLVIPDTVEQQFIITQVKERLFTLSALLISMSKRNSKVFVFMASSHMVEFHHQLFSECLVKMPKSRGKLKSGDVVILNDGGEDDEDSEGEEIVMDMPFFKLHGSMDQQERKEVFRGFRDSKKGVLLCTDVAARGIDVPTADCIIQYTGPQTDGDYLHRVGRTGRAGKSGYAVIFLTSEEEQYVRRLKELNVSLNRCDPRGFFYDLCELMEEPDPRLASLALQRRYENAVANDKALHRTACFAYSSWARFYNSYPASMREIFNIKKVNIGHYVSSFAIRDPPSMVSKVVRGQVKSIEKPRLNKKLANHEVEDSQKSKNQKRKSISLTTSEYGSGLESSKKKKKKKNV